MNTVTNITVDANLFSNADNFKMHLNDRFEEAKLEIFNIVGATFDIDLDYFKPVVKPVAIKKDVSEPKLSWSYNLSFDKELFFFKELDIGKRATLEGTIDENFKLVSAVLTLYTTHNNQITHFKAIKVYFSSDTPLKTIKIRYHKPGDDVAMREHSEEFEGSMVEAINKGREFFDSIDYSI